MDAIRYRVRSSDEDRKQLYWGAFMQGCAAFHQHRHAGYWLDQRAVSRLASACFRALMALAARDAGAYVDDEDLGWVCFCCAFLDGYDQRLLRCGADGLVLRSAPLPSDEWSPAAADPGAAPDGLARTATQPYSPRHRADRPERERHRGRRV